MHMTSWAKQLSNHAMHSQSSNAGTSLSKNKQIISD